MTSSSQFFQKKYDVFISFRGPDTRRGFVSHLSEALSQKKIVVFVDDKLETGDEISPALLGAIERSQISLIIFSREYAFSKWCLDELVKIMTCWKRNGQVVIPIFYDIDPSDVRNQKGRYGDAITKYGEKFKDNWSIAMKEAANLSGFHSSKFGTDAELIKKIVDRVLKRLKHINMGQNNSKVLVGIHEQVAFLESLVALQSDVVHVIGIWGMGGIGKTTIAKELYDRLCFEYEACCFMPNVRENLQKYGVTRLQNELFCALVEEKDQSIGIPIVGCQYNMMRLGRKKVLLVLDDVDDLRKLTDLCGGRDCFGQGSRVILISRDKQLLTNVVDDTYEVQALKFEDSLQLFSLHAFKENYPKLEWMDLSKTAVEYANGIPLAIEVLGSSLFGQDRKVWESQLEKLKKMPLPEIQNVLRLSYDGLDREEQDIFLYCACFYQTHGSHDFVVLGSPDFHVILLDDCGYSTRAGLTKLCNKALLFDDSYYWKMHDLIRAMGKEIVCGESRDPGNRRHLWEPHDVYQVLENATGTGAIQSLFLDMKHTSKELYLNPKAFNGMFNLKFLNLDTYDFVLKKRKMFAPKDLESMPNGLRFLSWVGCPLKSLPSSFCVENLFRLDLSNSCLERLWDGVQNLVKLKELDLERCEQLIELPDFSKALNLQVVVLSNCLSLCYLHPSILSLQNLQNLYLDGCEKLKSLRSDIYLKSLSWLIAKGCSSMNEFSLLAMSERMLTMDLRLKLELDLRDTGIAEVHSLGLPLKKLEILNCELLKSLPQNFLQVLDLGHLRKLTLDFFAPSYSFQLLENLLLSGTNIESLPASIKHLSNLDSLELNDCKKLRFLPELPPSISQLVVGNCVSLEEVSTSTLKCYNSGGYCNQYVFRNCWRLNQQTLNTIMSDAHVMMKQAAYIGRLDDEFNGVRIILPGSKVPADKYHYRTTTESTMTIQLSSQSNFQGVIVCLVISRCQIQRWYPLATIRCYLQTSNGQEAIFKFDICHCRYCFDEEVQCDSDHVFLWHDTTFLQRYSDIIESSADNQCRTYNPKLSFTISTKKGTKLKEWGIYPIYGSDLFNFSNQLALGGKTKRYRDADELLDIDALPPAEKLKIELKKRNANRYRDADELFDIEAVPPAKKLKTELKKKNASNILFWILLSSLAFVLLAFLIEALPPAKKLKTELKNMIMSLNQLLN